MLHRGYFVLTFVSKSEAREALTQSPLYFGSHLLYLQPWRPQFNPLTPTGIKIPLRIFFPKLDNFYRALSSVCPQIGKAVWLGIQVDYLKKSSTPNLCILLFEIKHIPSTIILPIPFTLEEVELKVEYEGIPCQCSHCLELKHEAAKCLRKTRPREKMKTTTSKKPTGSTHPSMASLAPVIQSEPTYEKNPKRTTTP
uniref:DUF4283 domain-containing protein n=1 Tax=Physcomitrium patens TaxID=3218 RepID=A0A2K1IUA1_PHYPA|nr:hypothetical protein PHYPA_024799 [Physcomitrium patens]